MLSEEDLIHIAEMHFEPHLESVGKAGNFSRCKYRFFYDKVKLFYSFDPESIILERNEEGKISGVLIYTQSESAFNRFTGPGNPRFYVRLLKTLFFYYGFDFKKYFLAGLSMLGFSSNPSGEKDKSDYGKIWVLLVAIECRRQGIANRLLEKCIIAMHEAGKNRLRVTVTVDNQPAINAYQKRGFEIIGKCHESSGDSHVMELLLQ